MTNEIADITAAMQALDPAQHRYVQQFEAHLAELAQTADPAFVPEALKLFDDEAPFDEVMFSIIHTIEIFNDRTYVRALLPGLAELISRAPRWASILMMRILNTERTVSEFSAQIMRADTTTQGAVASLLHRINERSETFLPKTQPVLRVLELN